MKGLKIQITKVAHRVRDKQSPVVVVIVFVLVGILLLPILIPVVLIALLFKLFSKNNLHVPADHWMNISTYTDLKLSCKWLSKKEVPHVLAEMDEILMIFRADPMPPFFKGYFTAFKVERTNGIFVQKVEMDDSHRMIAALPLYFFDYETRESELIRDFKGYVLETKGEDDDFLIIASSESEDLEIWLSR